VEKTAERIAQGVVKRISPTGTLPGPPVYSGFNCSGPTSFASAAENPVTTGIGKKYAEGAFHEIGYGVSHIVSRPPGIWYMPAYAGIPVQNWFSVS
jgi:hypothetical protein